MIKPHHALSLLLLAACAGDAPTEPAEPAAPEAPAEANASQPSTTADAAASPSSPAQPGLLTEAQFAALHQLKAEDAPPAKGTEVSLEGGGTAYLSLPEGEGPHPGVLVIHEWWGLNSHIKHWTDRLAADGYAALAVDLYEGKVAGSPEEAMAAMKAVDEAKAGAVLKAAHAFLVADPRVQAPKTGVIGWCFGGSWSLRTALSEPELDAAVMYYGRIPEKIEEQVASLHAPLLGVFGERDQGIPVESVRSFEAAAKGAGKAIEILFFDAEHAFANPSGQRYDAASAEQAWTRARAFLGEHLKG